MFGNNLSIVRSLPFSFLIRQQQELRNYSCNVDVSILCTFLRPPMNPAMKTTMLETKCGQSARCSKMR